VADIGLPLASIEDLRGGTAQENAATMRRLFQGEVGPIRDAVLLNGGAALMAGDQAKTLRQGIHLAAQVIDSGGAMACLDALVELSQGLEE
jgi:anthranilate phosphoribosyltransferase